MYLKYNDNVGRSFKSSEIIYLNENNSIKNLKIFQKLCFIEYYDVVIDN